MNILHLTLILTLLPNHRESSPCLQSAYLSDFLLLNNLPGIKYDAPLATSNIINHQLPFHKKKSNLKKQTQHANKPLKSASTSPPKSKLILTISTILPTKESTTQSTILSLLPSTALFPAQTIIPSTIESIEPHTTLPSTQTAIPTTTQPVVSPIIKPEESSHSFYQGLLKELFNPSTTKRPLTTRSTTQSVASFVISPEDTLLPDIPSEMPQESSKSFFSGLFNHLIDQAATKPPILDWGISWGQPSQSDSNFNSNPINNQYMNDPMQFDQEFSNYPDNPFVNQLSPMNLNIDNQYSISDPLYYPPLNNQYSTYYEYGYPQYYPEMMPPQYP